MYNISQKKNFTIHTYKNIETRFLSHYLTINMFKQVFHAILKVYVTKFAAFY